MTGDWITDEQATEPRVLGGAGAPAGAFAAALRPRPLPATLLLEVGPGRSLSSMARQTLGKAVTSVTSLNRPEPGDAPADARALATALGSLWAAGAWIDWAALYDRQRRRRVALPAYPYERVRFWLGDDPESTHSTAAATAAPATQAPATDGGEPDGITYLPVWRQRRLGPSTAATTAAGTALVFTLGDGPVETIARDWSRHGRKVVRVLAGDGFADLGDDSLPDRPGPARRLRRTGTGAGGPRHPPDGGAARLDRDPGRRRSVRRDDRARRPRCRVLQPALPHSGLHAALAGCAADGTVWPRDIRRRRHRHRRRRAGQGAAAGPAKVVPIELNQVTVQLIDLGPGAGAAELLAELAVPATDPTVAYRGGRRWAEDYELATALDHPVAMPHGLRRRGVYLITGGLGDIGVLVARRLAQTAGARLVLTGRTALPPRELWDGHLAEHGTDKMQPEHPRRPRA